VDLQATGRICVVEDDVHVRKAVERSLSRAGHEVMACGSVAEAMIVLESGGDIDLVISDLHMPLADGFALLERMHTDWPDVPVVMLTGDEGVQPAIQAIRGGAFDYLLKANLDPATLLITTARALSHGRLVKQANGLRRQLAIGERFEGIVGESMPMRQVFRLIESVAPTDATVLVLGESGTGKELIARALHERSRRRGHPFVAINSSSLTDTLLESELFGHVRGAFSGATSNRVGLFQEASGGTLFLDEVGDISPGLQLRLLRVLQEGEIKPVGSNEVRKVDVRVVAATHRDLSAAVKCGTFREDLYYRLDVVPLRLPPLREREDDLLLLTQHFVTRYARKYSKVAEGIDPQGLQALRAHHWPGNVRELENIVQRAVILSTERLVRVGDLAGLLVAPVSAAAPDLLNHGFAAAKQHAIDVFEKSYLTSALNHAEGNLAEAARRVGVDKANFRRLLRRIGVRPAGV
jgi:two-component system response regulator HydG